MQSKKKKRPQRKRDSRSIGAKILDARKRADLSQAELAHAIGYRGDEAGAYISRVENGHQTPRLETIQRIAEALQVSVCSLLPG